MQGVGVNREAELIKRGERGKHHEGKSKLFLPNHRIKKLTFDSIYSIATNSSILASASSFSLPKMSKQCDIELMFQERLGAAAVVQVSNGQPQFCRDDVGNCRPFLLPTEVHPASTPPIIDDLDSCGRAQSTKRTLQTMSEGLVCHIKPWTPFSVSPSDGCGRNDDALARWSSLDPNAHSSRFPTLLLHPGLNTARTIL